VCGRKDQSAEIAILGQENPLLRPRQLDNPFVGRTRCPLNYGKHIAARRTKRAHDRKITAFVREKP
jgi:hypothetical protein